MTPSLFSQFFPWLNLHSSNRDVIVDASRGTRLTSHFHFSGDPRIEEEVIEKIASYGKQLGILSEAVLALAGEEGEKDERVMRLKKMADEINDIKKKGSLWIPDWLGYFAQICLLRKPEGRRIICYYC